jgi:arsenical pump membrane protein
MIISFLVEIFSLIGNATFTLISLIIISLILDEAGFFQWLALNIAHLGKGNGRFLWVFVVIVGVVITAIFTNDGTILIWTPTVLEMVMTLGFKKPAIFAFVMAVGFIADATSLPLPVSNLTNIITTDLYKISFVRYVLIMFPLNLVAAIASIAVLWFYFVPYIPVRYNIAELPSPDTAIKDPLVFKWSFPVLIWLLVGYFLAKPLGLPVAIIPCFAAWVMIGLGGRLFNREKPVIDITKILKNAPWKVVIFSLGMYVLVIGLKLIGISKIFTLGFMQLAQSNDLIKISNITGFFASFLSSISNNLPAVLFNSVAIKDMTGIDKGIQEMMIYANLIGSDIGAKITPNGSLGTLLWLYILKSKGIKIKWSKYIIISLVLTVPVLLVTLMTLALWWPWLI